MGKRLKMWGFWLAIILMLMSLGIPPCHAGVPEDIAAGLPLDTVIDNGLKAGLSLDTIIVLAMDSGVEPCPVIKAALARGLDLTTIFKLLTDYCANTLTGTRKDDPAWCEACTTCGLMKCAIQAVRDPVEIANAMMAIGADLDQVRECLGIYTYNPPGPPPSGSAPTFPGSGGNVVSPSS